MAIVGQNGAGKTTTVKMLNGLLKPGKGDVTTGGMNTKEFTVAQMSRIVGYVFQNPDDQIFHSTIYDEVAFGLRAMKKSGEEIEKNVNEALRLTGMSELKEENPFNLPFSMRKFISIAAILAMDTEVMIFDEPTAGQDLAGNLLLSSILEYLQQKGKTVITISHDMEFVARNFKRVVIMADKKIITSGSPSEIFWNFDALDQAMLKQPYAAILCKLLNLGTGIVTLEETVQAILKKTKKLTE